MNKILGFFLGIAMCFIGIWLLLSNINVDNISFYKLGNVNTAPILIIALIIFIVVAVVKSEWYTWTLVGLDIVMIIISVIMGTHFSLKHMSALQLILMVLLFAVGLGLIIRGLFVKDKKADSE